jgi:hypothetical protein
MNALLSPIIIGNSVPPQLLLEVLSDYPVRAFHPFYVGPQDFSGFCLQVGTREIIDFEAPHQLGC